MRGQGQGKEKRESTVYCDGNALSQLVSICPYKRWYGPELVELQIFGTERPLGNVGVNNVQVKLVRLGHGSNGYGTWVRLEKNS